MTQDVYSSCVYCDHCLITKETPKGWKWRLCIHQKRSPHTTSYDNKSCGKQTSCKRKLSRPSMLEGMDCMNLKKWMSCERILQQVWILKQWMLAYCDIHTHSREHEMTANCSISLTRVSSQIMIKENTWKDYSIDLVSTTVTYNRDTF